MGIYNMSDVEGILSTSPSIRDLHSVWAQRRPIAAIDAKKSRYGSSDAMGIPWLEDATLARQFVAHALHAEEFLLVIDAAREILRGWENAPENDLTELVRIRMDYASALTRLGFTREARHKLERCIRPDFKPALGTKLKASILLQLGNILREESQDATARSEQLSSAEEALGFYRQALVIDPQQLDALVWSASTAFILESDGGPLRAQSQDTARSILDLTKRLEEAEGPRRRTTWAQASAHAVLGTLDDAYRHFEMLQKMDGITTAHLAEVRFHAQFLAEAQSKPRDFFKHAFPPLQLIVFAGHIADQPNGPVRLPPASIPAAREALLSKLKAMDARVGLASASAGADLLFAEVLGELKGILHLVLPWSQEEFRRTSVKPFDTPGSPPEWEQLFERALETATTTREIGQVYEPGSDVGWEFMMEVTAGIALQTARSLRLDLQPMVLWDGKPGRGAGGTSDFHSFWKNRLGIPPIVIDPPIVTPAISSHIGGGQGKGCERPILHQEVKSMLFADIVGYSKLTEKAIPEYIETFLKRLGQLAATSKHAPCSVNTWGDALYAVFDFAKDAGLFALELTRMIHDGKSDWLAKGLYSETRSAQGDVIQHPLDIRIGLHTGPVVMHYDPVVRRIGFTGAHVNRAARIEPVAEPGQVFASEEFAAMVELSGAIEQRSRRAGGPQSPGGGGSASISEVGFVCEYAGSMQLAKGYPGLHRIYRVVERRVFVLESLAKAAHEAYCAECEARGDTPATNSSLRPWEELSEDLREASRAQVADIPNKLRWLRFELAPSHGTPPSEIVLTGDQMEEMAMREHDRWMEERRRQGWTYATVRDNARKHHPSLVPWERLPELEKQKDRDAIRNLPMLIAKAGFNIRPIG